MAATAPPKTNPARGGREAPPDRDLAFSQALVALLRGVVYREADPALWQALLSLRPRVTEHMGPLGLELMVDEAEGYAWLRQREAVEGEAELPRLVPRRPLGFHLSLLLAMLRKRMAELDASGGDARLVLSRGEIVDLVRLFARETQNEARVVDQVQTQINKVVELGFLRRLRSTEAGGSKDAGDERYEIRRILKAFVDAQFLADLNTRLAEYREHLDTRAGAGGDGEAP